ncbi:hypothetical protein [Nocardioides solisilvae]|uniref:hypothetical protein n=1 Tax=Nocardioides solisilvae TaxID=1542435 RepID=UPI000D74C6AB|nr:hypothetical protein [Nocardioides solisilvae]
MDASLGTELPQRGVYVWGGLGIALVMLLPTVRAFRRAAGEQEQVALAWAVSSVMALVLVVVPALTAWVFARKHVFVSEEAVTVTAGDRVKHQHRFDDVTEVRVLVDGGLGSITPEFWNQAVAVRGPDQDGKVRWTKVSRTFVTTLEPLLRRLSEEVGRRPELIRSDEERELLQEYLAGTAGE